MKDLGYTVLTSGATVVALMILIRILAEGLGPEKFGVYSVARRLLSTVEPLSTAGMGVALARYVAMEHDQLRQRSYLVDAILIAGGAGAGVALLGLMVPVHWIFHDEQYQPVLFATGFFIFTYSLFIVLYAYYRGVGRMGLANRWQIAVVGVGPVLVAAGAASSGRVELVIGLTALLHLASLVPLAGVACTTPFPGPDKMERTRAGQLLRFSVPRIPGILAFGGLLAVGPLLAPYFGPLRHAGYLVIAQYVLRVVEGATEGFGRASLPKLSQLFAEGRREYIRERTEDLVAFALQVGLFSTLHLIVWTDQFILAWLGPGYAEAVAVVQVLSLGLMPFLLFSVLRPVVDGIEERAVTTAHVLAALGATLAVSLIGAYAGLGLIGLTAALALGLWVLGLLTLAYLSQALKLGFSGLAIPRCLLLNVPLFLLALGLKAAMGPTPPPAGALAVLGAECLLFAAYIAGLGKLGVRWIDDAKARLLG